MPIIRRLRCPNCLEGYFPYVNPKPDSQRQLSVKVRVCPVCGLERTDTHIISYRESEPAPHSPLG